MRAIFQYKALVMVVKRMSLLKAEDPHIIQPDILPTSGAVSLSLQTFHILLQTWII